MAYKAKSITGAQARVRELENRYRNTVKSYEQICVRNRSECEILAKERDLAHVRINQLENAVRWALGEIGDFRGREEYEGQYYWRKELRERSGVVYVPPAE